jgi:glycosyltransferase involved in cell wall biosynthesis
MTQKSSPTRHLVSIVLPTLNGSRYIRASIESCLAQTYAELEVIVVDGGSTDGTPEIVESISDPRMRLIFQPGNADRLPGALNIGFDAARGQYYTWAQDDDLYAPEALTVLVDGLERNPRAGLVYAGQVFIDDDGEVIRESQHLLPEDLAWTNSVGHCFLYRRTVAETVGRYEPRFAMAEDAHYWMRIHRQSEIVRLPGRHYYHRLHERSLTGRDYGAYRALRVAAEARREVLGLEPPAFRRQVAAAYIEEAYAAHALHDFAHVHHSLSRAAVQRPRSVLRRPIVSLWVRSLAGAARGKTAGAGTR